jgi:hypothetical protein
MSTEDEQYLRSLYGPQADRPMPPVVQPGQPLPPPPAGGVPAPGLPPTPPRERSKPGG